MRKDLYQRHADIEQRHWWFVARRTIVAALAESVLGDEPDAPVLDIGCGTGGNTAAFAKRGPTTGLDPHPDAIAFASERFPEGHFVAGHPGA